MAAKLDRVELEHIFSEYVFGFMQKDVERELALKDAPGGGSNVLAAMGLLAFTEFLGVLVERSGARPIGPMPKLATGEARFLEGFYRLGMEYADLHRSGGDPWRLRNDLLHAYAIDNNAVVYMTHSPGITGGLHWHRPTGRWDIVVDNYLADFLRAATHLRDEIRELSA